MAKHSSRTRNPKFLQAPQLRALNSSQARLIDAIGTSDMVVTTGYAGTGKTYVSATLAAEQYDRGVANGGIDKIILTRPNIGAGPSVGFRPGTMTDKLREWFAESLRTIGDAVGKEALEIGIKRGNIEMVPFETMRGRSFDNAFVMLDEAQNTTPEQMKMAVTRIGEGSTYVVNGDIKQSDLYGKSGLFVLLDMIKRFNMPVPVIEFGIDDIVRGELCRQFIVAFDAYEIEEGFMQ